MLINYKTPVVVVQSRELCESWTVILDVENIICEARLCSFLLNRCGIALRVSAARQRCVGEGQKGDGQIQIIVANKMPR